MGIFSRVKKSFKKSDELQRLQKIIAPPQGQLTSDYVRDVVSQIHSGSSNASGSSSALEEYLDLCESDEAIAEIMSETKLTRENLKQLYITLESTGMGWVKGHYTPLSTIAYREPLLYCMNEQGKSSMVTVAGNLTAYWKGAIGQGGLYALVQD